VLLWLVLNALGSQALEERVEPGDRERDSARPGPLRIRLDEEGGVLAEVPEHLVPEAQVCGSAEEPRVPIDARVEIGYRHTGEDVRNHAVSALTS
jgi:hypothetical protein